jgi:hypothetical protein
MKTEVEKREDPKTGDTEQYVKDVRSVTHSDEDITPLQQDEIRQSALNEQAQEENKKSQMNAELDAKFGDSSDPERGRK